MTHPRNAGDDPPQSAGGPVIVSSAFLLKGIALFFFAAILCVFLTLCLLFYQGQWQLVFHPSHIIDRTPASVGLRYSDIRFDATETGHLQLTGWFIPAEVNAKYASATALLCHDNVGSLSDSVNVIARLHTLGINVFVFDYRGFGKSDWAKPSEQGWHADTGAAYRYLTDTRHISPQRILLYGVGLGANAAAYLATASSAAALIVINPVPEGKMLVAHDLRARFVPMRVLFRKQFDWSAMPIASKTPTLFIEETQASCRRGNTQFIPAACKARGQAHGLFIRSAAPKMYSEFGPDDKANNAVLERFLDEYLSAN